MPRLENNRIPVNCRVTPSLWAGINELHRLQPVRFRSLSHIVECAIVDYLDANGVNIPVDTKKKRR